MTTATIVSLLGVFVAVCAHLALSQAERRAREYYVHLMGDAVEPQDDHWQEIRPLAGAWGCLVPLLGLLRVLGLVVALGAVLLLLSG